MQITSTINHVINDKYDVDINVTDIPVGHFIAVTSNSSQEGADERQVIVSIMPLEQSPGGTMLTNTGVIRKKPTETSIKITVDQDGKEMATGTVQLCLMIACCILKQIN